MDRVDGDATREFRRLIIQRVEETPAPFEIALSGGVDSAILLFAALEAGLNPRCLTFHMDGVESADLKSARRLAEHFDVELHTVTVPSDADSLARDVRRALPHCHTVKKTIVQCLIPWLYLYPAMEAPRILIGVTADDFYCNQRKVQVALHQHGEDAIRQYRRSYARNPNFSTANIIALAAAYDRTCIDVYDDARVESFFLRFPARLLNRPYPKHLSVRAFQDYYRQGAFRRERSSYQVDSGLRDLHRHRLLPSEHNPSGYRAEVGLYRAMARELGLQP